MSANRIDFHIEQKLNCVFNLRFQFTYNITRLYIENPHNLQTVNRRLNLAITTRLDKETARIAHARALVKSLSPQSALSRGYAILTDADGATVTAAGATIGATVAAQVSDGSLTLTVTDKKKEDHGNRQD